MNVLRVSVHRTCVIVLTVCFKPGLRHLCGWAVHPGTAQPGGASARHPHVMVAYDVHTPSMDAPGAMSHV